MDVDKIIAGQDAPHPLAYLGGHHLYCEALPPDNGACNCGLAVRARLMGEG